MIPASLAALQESKILCTIPYIRLHREATQPRRSDEEVKHATGRLLLRVSDRLRVREILIGGRPYLERYYLGRLGPVTLYLHRFLGRDGERQVHDHPWTWSVGIPLVGGYTEERLLWLCPHEGWRSVMRRVRWFAPNVITARTFHRVARVEPGTWTLFVHGRRVKGWGFLEREHAGVRYHQPYDVWASAEWTRNAPTGREMRERPEERGDG